MWYFITEVIIALLLLVGMLFMTYAAPIPVELETLYLKSRIWNSLKALDDGGELRDFALANQSLEIKSALSKFLPGIELEVNICYSPYDIPCRGITLPFKEVVTITYFLAGDYGNFRSMAVVVSSWFE